MGAYGFLLLLVTVLLGTAFGPTSADPAAVAAGALALWVAVPVAYRVDGHRETRA